MNRIYFVRHGENPANLTMQLSHRIIDYPLTEKGVLQAQQTAAALAGKGISAVYASPLRRAGQTAEIIAARLGLAVTILEDLREINVGDLDGLASDEAWTLHNAIIKDWFTGKPETAFPAGEDYPALCRRMQRAVEDMTEGRSGESIVAVGHGGALTCTMPVLCRGVDVSALLAMPNHNCSITEMIVEGQDGATQASLASWSNCDHLSGAAAELVPGWKD